MINSISKQISILLLGGGKMGSAMLEGWLNSGVSSDNIHIIEPCQEAQERLKKLNIHVYADIDEVQMIPSLLLLAVKPQILDILKDQLISFVTLETLVISIAAGKNMSWLQSVFSHNQPIIRAMPNTPAQIKKGITALYASQAASHQQVNLAHSLLLAIGDVVHIDNEQEMDAITALSGGGPAWVFLLTEAMQKAGIKQGLSRNLAAKLARKTVEGAAALMEADATISPQILRENVTSEGGTTAQAMKVLMGEEGWQKIINKAMKASTEHSKILSK